MHDQKLRLFFGNRETGQCWLEENDVLGFIGRSMGPMRIPILLANRNILLGDCVRILGMASVLHPQLGQVIILLAPKLFRGLCVDDAEDAGGQDAAAAGTEPIARFKTPRERARWLAFMQGQIMKP
ncbi:MAG: hypothetical protein ACLPXB_01670 [Thiobacillaceae bacterium]